jgi:23S rRNA pseudouridine1911/1915/1917 synthase
MENNFRIFCDQDDVRIDVFLSERLSLPRSRVKNLIEAGHVRIGAAAPKPSYKVKKGTEIEGEIPPEAPSVLVAEDIPVPVLYEDDSLIVIDKPADMVVHPSAGHAKGTLLNAILSRIRDAEGGADERPGIVHRLDKGTTGVIIVAKDRRTQEALSRQFHERSVEKIYRAVVEGAVSGQEGIVEGHIGRHPQERKKMAMVGKGGRTSFSRYHVIERLKGYTYVEVYPKTGRTHQIRVHMNFINHPIVGDELYGRQAKHAADRPLLHAFRIAFDHPVTGVKAPVPDDMNDFVKRHRAGTG